MDYTQYEQPAEEEEDEDEEDVEEEAVCHGCHPHKVYKPGRSGSALHCMPTGFNFSYYHFFPLLISY